MDPRWPPKRPHIDPTSTPDRRRIEPKLASTRPRMNPRSTPHPPPERETRETEARRVLILQSHRQARHIGEMPAGVWRNGSTSGRRRPRLADFPPISANFGPHIYGQFRPLRPNFRQAHPELGYVCVYQARPNSGNLGLKLVNLRQAWPDIVSKLGPKASSFGRSSPGIGEILGHSWIRPSSANFSKVWPGIGPEPAKGGLASAELQKAS